MSDPLTSTWTRIDFSDVQIRKSLDELNRCTFQSSAMVSTGTLIKVLYTSTEVFRGYVQRRKFELGTNEMEAVEHAIELRRQLVDYNNQYRHLWQNLTGNQVIDRILNGSGWKRITSNPTIIPSISIEYADRLKALSKIAKDVLGSYIFFRPDRAVAITSVNINRVGEGNYYYTTKSRTKDQWDVVDKVIVLGRGDGINQVKAEYGTGTNVKVFLAKDAHTSTEALEIAKTLYDKYSEKKVQCVVTGSATPRISEADRILVDNEEWMVYEAEHRLTESRLVLGSEEPSVGSVISAKVKGVEDASYVAQGVTNVANFGGWYTAVASTFAATYKFFLPDAAVGHIKTNEAYINVYGEAYRIWSKGAASGGGATQTSAAGAVGVNVNDAQAAVSADRVNFVSPTVGAWYEVVDVNPSLSFSQDIAYIFACAIFEVEKEAAVTAATIKCQMRLYDETVGSVIATSPWQYCVVDGELGYGDLCIALFAVYPVSSNRRISLQVTIGNAVAEAAEAWVSGYICVVSKHDHGTHTHNVTIPDHIHDPEPGIWETADYPSNVNVYVNNQLVASPASHPDLVGGSTFSVTKIDIKDYVQPGENIIEIRSATLGLIGCDGFYRIFVETRE